MYNLLGRIGKTLILKLLIYKILRLNLIEINLKFNISIFIIFKTKEVFFKLFLVFLFIF